MGPREVVGGGSGGASGSSSVGFSSSFLPLLVRPVEKNPSQFCHGARERESKVRLTDVPFLYSYHPIEFRYKLSPIREMDFA